MENITVLILIIGDLLLSYLFIRSLLKLNNVSKDRNHQKALVSVLRHRLNDRQDNSQPFTLKELKEVNIWSGKRVNEIYAKCHNMPIYENPPKPPNTCMNDKE